MGRKTLQEQAVERLMASSDRLFATFGQNYTQPNMRAQLQQSFLDYNKEISKRLAGFTEQASNLRSALQGPKGAYNTFVSTWNNGQGDPERSYNRLSEYHTLLQNAQPEIKRLISELDHADPDPPEGKPKGARGNPKDLEKLDTILKLSMELEEMLPKAREDHYTGLIVNLVKEIRTSLGTEFTAETEQELQLPRKAWSTFYEFWKHEQSPSKKPLGLLEDFTRLLQGAVTNLSQPARGA